MKWGIAKTALVKLFAVLSSFYIISFIRSALPPSEGSKAIQMISLYFLATTLAVMGTNQFLLRNISKYSRIYLERPIIQIVCLGSISAMLLSVAFLRISVDIYIYGALLFGVSIIVGAFIFILSEYLRSMNKLFTSGVLYSVLPNLILIAFLNLHNVISLSDFLLYHLVSNLIVCIMILSRYLTIESHSDKELEVSASEILRQSYPNMLVTLLAYINLQGDIWIASAILKENGADEYIYGSRIAFLIGGAGAVFSSAAGPRLSSLIGKGLYSELMKLLKRIYFYAFFIGFFQWLIIVSVGESIFVGIFGLNYSDSGNIVKILSFGQIFIIGTGISGVLLALLGKQAQLMYIIGIGSLIMLSVQYFFGSVYGLYGMAIAVAFSWILIQVVTSGVAVKYLKERFSYANRG